MAEIQSPGSRGKPQRDDQTAIRAPPFAVLADVAGCGLRRCSSNGKCEWQAEILSRTLALKQAHANASHTPDEGIGFPRSSWRAGLSLQGHPHRHHGLCLSWAREQVGTQESPECLPLFRKEQQNRGGGGVDSHIKHRSQGLQAPCRRRPPPSGPGGTLLKTSTPPNALQKESTLPRALRCPCRRCLLSWAAPISPPMTMVQLPQGSASLQILKLSKQLRLHLLLKYMAFSFQILALSKIKCGHLLNAIHKHLKVNNIFILSNFP